MLALYLTSLTLSAGVVGVFARQVFEGEGYVPNLGSAFALCAGVAALYGTIQFTYMAFVQMLKPTRAASPLFSEILSHVSAIVLLPYALQLQMPWPHPLLFRVEPLIYLGAFGVLHVLFKLMTFFAAMRGKPANRLRFALWLFAAVMTFGGGLSAIGYWINAIQELRPRVEMAESRHVLDGVRCTATEVNEGATLDTPVSSFDGSVVTYRLAVPPDAAPPERDRVTLDVYLYGDESKRYSTSLSYSDLQSGWHTVRIAGEFIPASLTRCEAVWTSRRESRLRKLIGLRPIQTSTSPLWVSGPYIHGGRTETAKPSFVLIAVEGLSSAHMSTFGYERDTTPQLDRFTARSLAYSNTYTPTLNAGEAIDCVLTGMGPLQLRRTSTSDPDGRFENDLAALLHAQGYTTAAFTEEGTRSPLPSVYDHGFEWIDATYVSEDTDSEDPMGSAATLRRARAWLDDNADATFLLFVRLHELPALRVYPRYGEGLTENLDRSPSPEDIYDSALAYLDGQIGSFVKHVRDQETRKFTTICLFSPYGIDFTAQSGRPVVGLVENSLRVPLLILSPGLTAEKRETQVSLVDVAPSLLGLAAVEPPPGIEGHSLFEPDYAYEPVSVHGDPMTMSLRTGRYQFLWNSGLSAETLAPVAPPEVVALNQITRKKSGYTERNVASRNPKMVQQYTEKLRAYAGIEESNAEDGVK